MDKDQRYVFKIAFSVVSTLVLLFMLMIGMIEGDQTGKCDYPSIASYFPSRVLGCELTRHRFDIGKVKKVLK